ncbi:MAG TPA: porin [Polyangiaceae bacterium]
MPPHPMLNVLALPVLLMPGAAHAPRWLDEAAQRVDMYGRLDGHLAFSEQDIQFANNSSRVGVMVEQPVRGGLTVLGQGEWRMNLGLGDTSYNISENPDTGLATFAATTNQAFSTRLGFVGLRFGKFGTLTFGKQWGVYYDVTQWTDSYVVFGATGSSTFNAGTDGGQTGEGRANDAVVYRAALGPLRVGVQAQFMSERSAKLDGFGGSLVYDTGFGLRVGVAYSHAVLDFSSNIAGYDGGDAQALSGGIVFDDAGWKIALLGTWTHDHELVATPGATVMFDTRGSELFVSRRIEDLVMLTAGFDWAIPQDLDAALVNPDYGTRDFLAGVRWLLDPRASSFVYIEARTGLSRDAIGERAEELVMLGIRFNYSLRKSLGLDPM